RKRQPAEAAQERGGRVGGWVKQASERLAGRQNAAEGGRDFHAAQGLDEPRVILRDVQEDFRLVPEKENFPPGGRPFADQFQEGVGRRATDEDGALDAERGKMRRVMFVEEVVEQV